MKDKTGESASILVIRLGALGDILHTLPAVLSLKRSFPEKRLKWLVARKWMPLLKGNPFIDELIPFDRGGVGAIWSSWRRMHGLRPALAFDFQGLLQSALAGRVASPVEFFGFDRSVARETWASMFYRHRIKVIGPHRIERNLQLALAAGASQITTQSWLPPGIEEGNLPAGPFILASPFAGWSGKEWPIASYDDLGRKLRNEGFELVLNVTKQRAGEVQGLRHVRVHTSSLEGLIGATRRATAVVGLDSGPLHLAAALHKPGVALYGPTDPAQTGPFGGSMTVLRTDNAETTYKRHGKIHQTMKSIAVDQVFDELMKSISQIAGDKASAISEGRRATPGSR